MNDLQKELQELKAKVADLESRIVAEPAKWQPKGGGFYINLCDEIDVVIDYAASDKHSTQAGLERKTKAQAQRAAVEMRRFNRLLALRDELCRDEDVDWTDDEEKYYLYFSHQSKCWYVSSDNFCESIAPYFTRENVAQRACDMLNSGEVGL